MRTEQRQSKMQTLWRGAVCFFAAAILLLTSSVVFAATELDQNQEVQWVMGDLSALKTAAQAYYSDNNNPQVPPLSGVLNYFDPGSLPPNASTLYVLRGDSRGWYVGYQAIGLQNETYRLLQSNAEVLGLLGDYLRTPWRFGNRYFWTEALALSPTAGSNTTTTTTTVIKKETSLSDVTGLVLATAALVNIIADNDHDHYYYYVPGHNWYWYSGLTYRTTYYNRFFRYYYRPLPVPPPRFYPVPRYRFRVPRAGWLAPDWRRRYDDAHRFYNPRYAHDWRLDNHYADRRWRDEHRRVPLGPPPPPPPHGRVGPPPPPPPHGRILPPPPPPGRGPRPGDDHFRPVPPPPPPRPRPDDRHAPDPHRPPPPRPPRPDGHSSPEFRRPPPPPRRPDGHFSPEFRRPEPHGRGEGFHPSPGRQAPPPPKRPENRPAPEMRRPKPPQEHPKRPPSPEQRRPAPPQRRPNDRNAPQIRRPEQGPRPGNDRNRQNIRPPQQQRRPDSGRSPREENRRPKPPQGHSERGQPRR